MSDANGNLIFKSRAAQRVEALHGASVEALLRRLYVGEGLSQEEIAARLGVHRITVLRWMADYRIATRDRRKAA